MQPNDYTLKGVDPTQNMNNAVSLGTNILQYKAAQAQMAQAQNNIETQKQMQADLYKVSQSHNPAAVAQLIVKYPQLSEQLKRGYDALGDEQKKSKVNMASQAYAALLSGDSDTASNLLSNYSDAYRNSGMNEDADAAKSMADLIKVHPEMAKTTAGLYLASAMGPEKFTENFTKLESERRDAALAPSKLTDAQAAAKTAAVKAGFANSDAAVDLQKKGWDIYKIQQDVNIAKENNRIAAIKASTDKETNDLKRQELQAKLKDAQIQRDQAVRDKVATVESSRSTIDNNLNTIDRLLKNPALDDVVGSLQGSAVGGVVNAMNPVKWNSDDRANAQADIDTVKSQTTLSQLMALKQSASGGASGLGALSDREGEMLQNGLQSLSTKQSEKQFRENLGEVQRLLLKARGNLVTKHGVPDTIPDTPNVKADPNEVDALVKKYGG